MRRRGRSRRAAVRRRPAGAGGPTCWRRTRPPSPAAAPAWARGSRCRGGGRPSPGTASVIMTTDAYSHRRAAGRVRGELGGQRRGGGGRDGEDDGVGGFAVDDVAGAVALDRLHGRVRADRTPAAARSAASTSTSSPIPPSGASNTGPAGAAAAWRRVRARRQQQAAATAGERLHLGHGAEVHAVGVGGVDAADQRVDQQLLDLVAEPASGSARRRNRRCRRAGQQRLERGPQPCRASRASGSWPGPRRRTARRARGPAGIGWRYGARAGFQIAALPVAGEVEPVAEAEGRAPARLPTAPGSRTRRRPRRPRAARRRARWRSCRPSRAAASSTVTCGGIVADGRARGRRRDR